MLSATVCSATSDATGNGSGIGAGSTSTDSRGRFVEVAGRVTARYGRNQWVFTPDDRTRRVGYVKFCLVLDIAVNPPWSAEAVVRGSLVVASLLVPRRWVKAWRERVAAFAP